MLNELKHDVSEELEDLKFIEICPSPSIEIKKSSLYIEFFEYAMQNIVFILYLIINIKNKF